MKTLKPTIIFLVAVAAVYGAVAFHRKTVAAEVAKASETAACVATTNFADRVAMRLLREFFSVAGSGIPGEKERAALAPMLKLMEWASPFCSEAADEQMYARRLDGAFIVGDYDKAQSLMDGLKGYSDNWKAGAKAKIRAHAALEKGDKAAAVKEFGAFVQTVVADESDMEEVDPYTGVRWTKNGILARNYKRMAELSAETGDAAAAADYRAKAVEKFKEALKEADDDEEAAEVLKKDAGDLLK